MISFSWGFPPSLLLFPPHCAICHEVIPIGLAACEGCVARLLTEVAALSRCPICGKPTPGCLCQRGTLFFSRCLSSFLYTQEAAELFTRLKSGDRDVTELLAGLMLDCWERSDLAGCADPDAIAFIPSVEGRDNQAEALALYLGERLSIKVLPQPLIRHQNSRVQHTLSFEERRKNAAQSYARNGNFPVTGLILLVDDVITTGATLSRCAQLLLQAGAREIICLTAATTSLDRECALDLPQQGGIVHAFK